MQHCFDVASAAELLTRLDIWTVLWIIQSLDYIQVVQIDVSHLLAKTAFSAQPWRTQHVLRTTCDFLRSQCVAPPEPYSRTHKRLPSIQDEQLLKFEMDTKGVEVGSKPAANTVRDIKSAH